MRILHVLSQFEVTGAEVYAATLINEQIRRRHTVLIVSDTFSTPTQARYIPIPIGDRSYRQRIRNIRLLVQLIRHHHIDLIHAHSRAASWLVHFVARFTRTAYVSTVHGRQHLHTSSKAFNIYGRDIIAISESIKQHLSEDLGIPSEYATLIPNCLDSGIWNTHQRVRKSGNELAIPRGTRIILFVGRLSGPKGDVARFVASKVMPIVIGKTRCVFCVIGGKLSRESFQRTTDEVNQRLGQPVVRLLEFQGTIVPFLKRADLVIGSGRVAMESLAMEKPTIAFGESDYIGRITPGNYEEAAKSNFGDTGTHRPIEPGVVAADVTEALRGKVDTRQALPLKERTRAQFDVAVVAPKIDTVYERAVLRARSSGRIPVLMYHRVVEGPIPHSRHGIWVTTSQFENQLRSLRRRGFTTITFRQYDEARRQVTDLPHKPVILTFDDGYEDNYRYAFPLLRKYGSTAVIFVTADLKRRTNHWDPDEPQVRLLTVSQMQELSSAGIELGSHSVSHARLTDLSPLRAVKEIARSKEILEQALGSPVLSFAYPYGAVNEEVRRLVEKSGYRYAVAGDQGPLSFYGDFYRIRRTQVFPWTTPLGFWKKTQPWYMEYKERKSR